MSVIKQESKPRRVIESYDSNWALSSELYTFHRSTTRIYNNVAFKIVKTEFYKQVVNF